MLKTQNLLFILITPHFPICCDIQDADSFHLEKHPICAGSFGPLLTTTYSSKHFFSTRCQFLKRHNECIRIIRTVLFHPAVITHVVILSKFFIMARLKYILLFLLWFSATVFLSFLDCFSFSCILFSGQLLSGPLSLIILNLFLCQN